MAPFCMFMVYLPLPVDLYSSHTDQGTHEAPREEGRGRATAPPPSGILHRLREWGQVEKEWEAREGGVNALESKEGRQWERGEGCTMYAKNTGTGRYIF